MKKIIEPVDRELLKKELTKKIFLRPTNKAENEIYIFTAEEAPNLMREVARLREETFRAAGGATGEEMDLGEMDTRAENPCQQLIVWDPDNEEIIGGYRFLMGDKCKMKEDGQPDITSAHLFHYSEYFIREYLPHTIELSRAWVQQKYQKREMGVKSLYALDNLWDGIGAVLYNNPQLRYLIGKVTTYPQFDAISRDLIFAYLQRYHKDEKGIVWAKKPIEISSEAQVLADTIFVGHDPLANFQLLQRAIRDRGAILPKMFSAYLNLSNTLRSFGTAIDDDLVDTYETGIMLIVDEMDNDKKLRYIGKYIDYIKQIIKSRRQPRKTLTSKHK